MCTLNLALLALHFRNSTIYNLCLYWYCSKLNINQALYMNMRICMSVFTLVVSVFTCCPQQKVVRILIPRSLPGWKEYKSSKRNSWNSGVIKYQTRLGRSRGGCKIYVAVIELCRKANWARRKWWLMYKLLNSTEKRYAWQCWLRPSLLSRSIGNLLLLIAPC